MVAVIDTGGNGDALARQIVETGGADTHLLGVFSAHSDRSGGIDDLIRLTRLFRVDDIIVDAMGGEESEIGTVVRKLGTIPTNVHLCTSYLQAAFPRQEPRLLFGSPVLTIYRRPLTGWGVVVKRAEDLALGSLLLFLFLPLMLAVAAAIRIDSPGPVLFRQKRLGFNNNPFEILKFRTMIHVPGPELDVPQAQRNDPRVTRVGRFLRRTSLDELPQLLNVLKGNMSLVGPRPHALAAQCPVCRFDRRLSGPAPRSAGHHRLGAGERPPRRNRHAGENAASNRLRSGLHRELDIAARPEDPVHDGIVQLLEPKRLLGSTSAPLRDTGSTGRNARPFDPGPASLPHLRWPRIGSSIVAFPERPLVSAHRAD